MAKKKIMIVDDDQELLSELEQALLLNDYEIFAVGDSVQALGLARGVNPDLIIVDLKMKGLNGFQLATRLKQLPETASIPILAMTGYFTREQHQELINVCGMIGCLKKPFYPLELRTQIETVLQNTK